MARWQALASNTSSRSGSDGESEIEIHKLNESQEIEIREIKTVQEKEIVMEEAMHDTEMKALLERKILNSILNTFDDGIINNTPTGVLLLLNKAAEKIFGYTKAEVVGRTSRCPYLKSIRFIMTSTSATFNPNALMSN
jgi:PAS domain-containing protein